jgi:drug/metabolite transporter (DMT)-like permease
VSASIRDYIQLHFIIILWGFTAILGLLIYVPPLELVFYRTFLAAFGLLIIIKYRNLPLRVSRSYLIRFLGTGFIIAAHWILFFGSARVSNASVCLAGMATTSFWTSLIEPLVNRRPIKLLEVFFGLIVIAGLYLIFHFEFNHALGLILALASAILASIFTVINSRFTHTHNHHTISFYEMAGASLLSGLIIPFYYLFTSGSIADIAFPSISDWGYLFILAIVCTVYPFTVSIELMKRISAFIVNLSINMEPVYGIILAFLIFGDKERMNSGFYLGTLVILFSVILYPIIRVWTNKNRIKKGRYRLPTQLK